jgi:hypothetical protein
MSRLPAGAQAFQLRNARPRPEPQRRLALLLAQVLQIGSQPTVKPGCAGRVRENAPPGAKGCEGQAFAAPHTPQSR